MYKKIIFGTVVLLLASFGFYIYTSHHKDVDDRQAGLSTTQAIPSSDILSTTITYTNNGFSPQASVVKQGATVTVKNGSSEGLQFSSDDHPTHTKEPELNLKTLAPGQTGMFIVTKSGKWGYHNHLNDTMVGTLTVTN